MPIATTSPVLIPAELPPYICGLRVQRSCFGHNNVLKVPGGAREVPEAVATHQPHTFPVPDPHLLFVRVWTTPICIDPSRLRISTKALGTDFKFLHTALNFVCKFWSEIMILIIGPPFHAKPWELKNGWHR